MSPPAPARRNGPAARRERPRGAVRESRRRAASGRRGLARPPASPPPPRPSPLLDCAERGADSPLNPPRRWRYLGTRPHDHRPEIPAPAPRARRAPAAVAGGAGRAGGFRARRAADFCKALLRMPRGEEAEIGVAAGCEGGGPSYLLQVAGDEHAPDIIAGQAKESPLMQMVTSEQKDERMPPRKSGATACRRRRSRR